jgi:hypothetical protein
MAETLSRTDPRAQGVYLRAFQAGGRAFALALPTSVPDAYRVRLICDLGELPATPSRQTARRQMHDFRRCRAAYLRELCTVIKSPVEVIDIVDGVATCVETIEPPVPS